MQSTPNRTYRDADGVSRALPRCQTCGADHLPAVTHDGREVCSSWTAAPGRDPADLAPTWTCYLALGDDVSPEHGCKIILEALQVDATCVRGLGSWHGTIECAYVVTRVAETFPTHDLRALLRRFGQTAALLIYPDGRAVEVTP